MIEMVPVDKPVLANYLVVYRHDGIEYEFCVVGSGINNAAFEARKKLSMKKGVWEILSVIKQE